jgi:signal transduction histidine kinase/ligand-binding sensor domain-containing protein
MRRIVCWLSLAGALALWSAPALALDPALEMTQYAHTAWKMSDGFTTVQIGSFAQTPDGYLWLGTAGQGLMRFDGVRLRPWQPPNGAALPSDRVRDLLVARDGTLWIGTAGGLASWNGHELRTYPQFDKGVVNGIVEDREGTIWVSGIAAQKGQLCAFRKGAAECDGQDGKFGPVLLCLYEDSKGTLWAEGSGGLWRWKPGPPQLYVPPHPGTSIQCMSENAAGALLLATGQGLWQFANGEFKPSPLPANSSPLLTSIFRDRDGGIWLTTVTGGLLHAGRRSIDSFATAQGLTAQRTNRVFEDREGNIWVSTDGGIDRFRPLPAVTYSSAQGIPEAVASVLAGKDGSVWASTAGGLYRWRDGHFTAYRPAKGRSQPLAPGVDEIAVEGLPQLTFATLFQDSHGRVWVGSLSGFGYLENERFVSVASVAPGPVDSIAEDKQGNIWVAHRNAGLLRISPDLAAHQVPLPVSGKTGDIIRIAVDPVDGGLWLGFFSGGIVHVVGGAVRASYDTAVTAPVTLSGVHHLRVAADGTVWAATDNGLSRIKPGRLATLNAKTGLPCDGIISSLEDSEGSTWIYTGCGLVRIAHAGMEAWSAAVDQGKPAPSIAVTVLDNGDGVNNFALPGGSFTPHLAVAREGSIWLPTLSGVTFVDPRHLYKNMLPPPVHVEQIVADRKAYALSDRVDLPPLVRDLTIDYTGLSLVAPEKMQFRYMLEGRDRDWEDAGNRRQAFYTDLAPGNYRFRVIASNNSGVWNEEGDSLAFSIAPTLWQTNWFLALCAIAFVAFLWEMYQLRMRQLARAQAIESRQRELELELAHANRLATMGQLTASIAHEVNQPLSASILNAGSALRWLKTDPPDLGEIRQALDRIVRDGNRAADVIGRIRSMVKKAPAEREDLVINTKVTNVLAIANSELLKHGIVIRTELAPDLPLVKGDRVQIQQVLLNLILNAAEAMSTLPDGPRELVIRSGRDESGNVLVSVRDTGPGLSPEAMDRIFHPFYTSKKEGLGLGLSICQSIIEAHGGRLWASANSPRGAVFQFTLPIGTPQ